MLGRVGPFGLRPLALRSMQAITFIIQMSNVPYHFFIKSIFLFISVLVLQRASMNAQPRIEVYMYSRYAKVVRYLRVISSQARLN